MKKLVTLIVLSFWAAVGYAQFPGSGGKMPNMNLGHVFGKLIDAEGKPVEFATVVVMKPTIDSTTKQTKEIMVKAQTTGANGEFDIKDLPVMGPLTLKISSVGFKNLNVPIGFAPPKMEGMTPPKPGQMPDPAMMAKIMASFEKDLGKIKVENDSKVLDAVTVTATKALLEMDIDKKTFNVEKNIVTAGGTAIDVMRNIPTLQVDIDGNVKLRNAAPTLFIDGRPTTLSLDQIPADVIEKVEVITNPSAKYDASGSMAGILNIVLKKNKQSGYNGMVNAGVDRLGGSNFMGNFNLRQNKFNLSLMAMNMRMRSNTEGNSERSSDIVGISTTSNQDIESKTKGMMSFSRLAFDYYATKKTSFSIAGILGGGKFSPSENILITNTVGGVSSLSNRISENERQFKPKGMQLGFRHNFDKAGEELTMDFNFFGGTNSGNSIYNTNYLTENNQIIGTQIQKNISNGSNKFMTFQTDYVRPLKNNGSLEAGARAQINSLSNINDNTLKPVGSDIYNNVTSASTNYESKNSVYAAYVSVSGKVGSLFSYKTGLRAESSAYDGKLLNTGDKFSNSYPLSLFPSIFLSKDLTKTDQLQLSVTRRVNRPNFFQIIPFVDYSDSLNITRGNADLVPEFTTSGEISYSKSKGTATFLTSVYYKHTNNLITRYLNQETNPISGKIDLINTYINANSSDNYGVEFTYTNKIMKWWDFTSNLNFYNSRINTENIENSNSQDALWTAFGKINNSFSLKNKWVIQLSGDYQGKTNMPVSQAQGFGPPMSQAQSSSQGYIKPFYGVDLAIKKSFLKNDVASLTLSANDIFGTRGNTQVSAGDGFSQSYYRLTNPQMIKLNFSFRFGQMDANLFKKNNNASSMEGMQMQ
ncbi:TonB-dependent receptor [Lacihabitans sp. CCS-44]|uniref:TonB-dependent receptor domain-containing protein n=1 Tax=Lacihabitans sp. CCS-44 TaxID=2487331 RepID=UPI0020CF53A0|nr:TonB-dependent receptor [Lacihabitans sp. CCS-44]MCP9754841.1 TonB-dependent receptor [Lacihabitans sp. CCS-44]